ncbi:hypothetical protein L6452_42633 [Arctium lappa]|uniref:Uncharacterized protein n=1 Tax=Arctium lappa TaxID=4217 RepID=A0ACB8XJE2_ARCLA|nr:hypothetical protein L6452_42633 [Arctium lappa]
MLLDVVSFTGENATPSNVDKSTADSSVSQENTYRKNICKSVDLKRDFDEIYDADDAMKGSATKSPKTCIPIEKEEKLNHHQQDQEILVTIMDTHKNPNLEETNNNHHVLPSSRDFERTHLQHVNRVSEKINDEDEGLVVVKKPSVSCSSSLLAAGGEQGDHMTTPPRLPPPAEKMVVEESGRERLKRHRVEMAGRVWIPDVWGHEDLLKDWIDCTVFDSSLGNNTIMSARAALVQEGRSTLRIENRC